MTSFNIRISSEVDLSLITSRTALEKELLNAEQTLNSEAFAQAVNAAKEQALNRLKLELNKYEIPGLLECEGGTVRD